MEGKLLKLKKGLYGLKQAGRLWYDNFDAFMKDSKFKNLRSEPCVYIGNNIIIALYVDDIIIAAPNDKIQNYMKIAQERYKLQQFKPLE